MYNYYNGWSSRETMLVQAWFLDGIDEPMTAKDIEDMVYEAIFENVDLPGFVTDMLDMGRINWVELEIHNS